MFVSTTRRESRTSGRVLPTLVIVVALACVGIWGFSRWRASELYSVVAMEPAQLLERAKESHDYVAVWPARTGRRPAAPLSLWIRRGDTYGASQRAVENEPNPSTKPIDTSLVLEIVVPFRPDLDSSLIECADGQVPFSGCRTRMARLFLERDYSDWDHFDVLAGPLPGADAFERDRASRFKTQEFWTRRDSNDLDEIVGWECSSAPEPIKPQSKTNDDSLRQSCFQFPHWWHRLWPTAFGYVVHKATYNCPSDCASYFLFQDRLAKVESSTIDYRPDRELVAAAWRMLSRQRVDARQPPTLPSKLPDARAYSAICMSLYSELHKWTKDKDRVDSRFRRPGEWLTMRPEWSGGDLQQRIRKQLLIMEGNCNRAATIAADAVLVEPQSFLSVLVDTTDVLYALEGSRANSDIVLYYATVLQAMKTTDGNALPTMVRMMTRALEGGAGSPRSELPNDVSKSLLNHAREIALHADDALSLSDLDGLRTAILGTYIGDSDRTGQVEFLKEWIASEESSGGAASARLLLPLARLGLALLYEPETPLLKEIIERLQVVWMAQPITTELMAQSAEKSEYAIAGYHLATLLCSYSHRQKSVDTVKPTLREIETKLGTAFGTSASIVQEMQKLRRECETVR